MNNIDRIYNGSKNAGDFAKGYVEYLGKVIGSFDFSAINKLVEEFEGAQLKGCTIFIAGNGGSASTATTMANDIGFDIIKKTQIKKPFRVFSLTDNNSVISAIANDTGYDNIFLNQLKIHYRKGDKLLVISVSGNSKNVVLAAEWVKSRGGRVIGFTGFEGGRLKEMCDVLIHAQTMPGEYGPVEDAHLIINHILAHWFQCKLK